MSDPGSRNIKMTKKEIAKYSASTKCKYVTA
jgi:hypothetical protein